MRCVWGKKRQKKSVQRFYMMDPLAEKYYSISPYAYVANNPLRFIDPTGMTIDDYYNEYGKYLYTDTQTSDNIRIIKQSDWESIKETHGQELYNTSQSSLGLISDLHQSSKAINNAGLSAEAISNIFTDIVSKMPDLDVNNLYNGKVSVYTQGSYLDGNPAGYNDPTRSNFASEVTLANGKSKVTVNTKQLGTLNTVSNIQSTMIHELQGHGLPLNFSDEAKTHHKAYELQFRHPSWKSVTPMYREQMEANHRNLLKIEKP